MMAFLAGKPVEGDRGADVPRGPAVRRRRQRRGLVGRRGIGRGEGRRRRSSSSAAACPASSPGSACRRPACRSRSSRRTTGPGGTWWENRYPGARVDVGSHHYCYSFEPSHHWSEYFCQQPELRDYFAACARQVRAASALPLRHRGDVAHVGRADAASWRVGIRNPDGTTEVLDARFVISAVGSLNLPPPAGHPRHGHVRRPVVPLGAVARTISTSRARVSRSIGAGCHRLPDRADDRRRGRAAHDLPAHGAVDAPEPAVPRDGSAR